MKKILMTLAAVLCCSMTTTVFTACGSDDDDNNNNNQSQEKVEPGKLLSAYAEFVVTTTGFDALEAMAADGKVMVRYNDANGAVKTEEMTSSTFQKAVNYSLNAEGNIVACMQVYINDINEEKVREVIGTQEIKAKISRKMVLKHENRNINDDIEYTGGFNQFDRSESRLDYAVRNLQQRKEENGLVPIATCNFKTTSTGGNISSSESWLGN